jgi:ribosomal protein L6P/L9E
MFPISKRTLPYIRPLNLKGSEDYSLLVVPSTIYFFINFIKPVGNFRALNSCVKGIVFGRYGMMSCGFPMTLTRVLNLDTATILIIKAIDSRFRKFFSLLRGYYKNIFISLNRGFRRTMYQYGLGFKSYYYPFQQQLVFKVGRSSRVYIPHSKTLYITQSKKRHRRVICFSAYKNELIKLLGFIQTKKPVSTYDPRKGVYLRGKLYFIKKSGKLARKGRKKK